jgi:gamma-glutamyltranspeptidase/glutathione hydrolase
MTPLQFDWSYPYPSQRMEVFARQGVATSQPLAAMAGIDMLKRGGNAVDAAVATAIALTVVEPTSNGIGSDAFALVWAGGGLHGFNGSGKSPAALTLDDFAGEESIPYDGWGGVTVPGCVSLWRMLSQRFGALPFAQLFEPAIHYARDGYHVSPQTAQGWQRSVARYTQFDSWMKTFAPRGRGPAVGELVRLPDHAKTLGQIADTNADAFYTGKLAAQIAQHATQTGGRLTADDLAAHAPFEVRPISINYHGYELNEIPPNGQGLVALLALGILRAFDLADMAVDSPRWLHLQIEAMKLAFADGHRYIADPNWMDADVVDLLDDAYLASRAGLIDPDRATPFDYGVPKPGGTVYLTAADAQGNMVSYIQSNYTGFGSGIVVPETGIALQNRGCCFTLEDGHPNRAAPSKRPYHTIIPGFVMKDGAPVMSFGVMGGFMQPQGHAQVMVRMVDHHQHPQAALDAPRWQVTRDQAVLMEPGFPSEVYEALRDMGHAIERAETRNVTFGRGQIIDRMDDGYCLASDQRSDGLAIGY